MSRRAAASPTAVTPRALPGQDHLSPDQVIDELHQQRAAAHQAEVREIELAVDWALLHPCPEDGTPASWGDGRLFQEQVTPLAGPGAPTVAEFAPADLAAALGVSFNAGRQLLADALELTYRLPTLWSLVHAGKVPGVARQVDRPGDPRPLRGRRRPRRPAHLRRARQDRTGPRHDD